MTREEILAEIRRIMETNFDIAPDRVQEGSNVVTDLDLDSIDATDIVVELQRTLDCRFTPEDFRGVKTVGDMVNVVISKKGAGCQ